ncbi:DUF423 domain-containing protein [Chelatococcus sp. HY11]|uniref:DUF423 domain-containing protein n=1 Tax=unclassified Chelatococcus TaxID=2638111 RepID=UPI0020BF215E|nr:DUF423 domain-containing protein [Chelatococcus sp. HY11]CAH1651828.1 conserved membrane hypothetical protein [Hyphomicrobiales bacterium]CAH1686166.1 conserved membrane hypothetical protein [Hyphomicrobiales bacterium]
MPISLIDRLFMILGAVAGLAGVAAAAAATHVTGGGSLGTAADFLLFHAPVLLAIAIADHVGLGRAGLLRLGGVLVILGLIGFSGDLAMRALTGTPLFAMAAPTGGTLLMIAWVAIGLSALIPRRS